MRERDLDCLSAAGRELRVAIGVLTVTAPPDMELLRNQDLCCRLNSGSRSISAGPSLTSKAVNTMLIYT